MRQLYRVMFARSLLLLLMLGAVVSTEVDLTYLNNNVFGNMYQYQARCSIPCSTSYRPSDLEVTITFDTAVYDLWTFGHFHTDQESPRRVWEIDNINYMYANSKGLCEFDVQVDYNQGSELPQGTCKIGWDPPPCSDVSGDTTSGGTCVEIRYGELHQCYNESIASQCCYSCTKFRMDLPNCEYGDKTRIGCLRISDRECYTKTTNTKCCMTCHQIEQSRQGLYSVPNCPYGNRADEKICSSLQRRECYTMETQCCDTCFWLAEDQYPGCRYGNRRSCTEILNRDCYNTTIANECCEICNGIRDDDNPDCAYGDKDRRCTNIDRNDCYDQDIRTSCCGTCAELANLDNPGCIFGDREECDDVTAENCSGNRNLRDNRCCERCDFLLSNDCRENDIDYCDVGLYRQDCYDDNIRNDCCEFCYGQYDGSISAFDCAFGDREDWCWHSIEPEDCYKMRTQKICCETCAGFILDYLEEDCKFGDRKPNECSFISGMECYNRVTARDCCEQCSYWANEDNPDNCRYGDRSTNCYTIAPSDCYDAQTEGRCCESCPLSNVSDEYGYACRYGDRRDSCYMEPYRECYKTDVRSECCKYCSDIANTDRPGCMYGDKSDRCDTLETGDCYKLEDTCCSTCPYHVLHIVIDDCKYGDRQNCSHIVPADCTDADVARQCCLTCHRMQISDDNCPFGDTATDCSVISQRECYSRQRDCCQTCQSLFIDDSDLIEDCDYGDRVSNCNNIADHQCYSPYRERECCETCYNRRNTLINVEDCLYGDWVPSCSDTRFHSSECYNMTRRQLCCETCNDLRTTDESMLTYCLYGDKAPMCQTIMPTNVHLCYQLESQCCQSCLQYRDDNFPDCKYGDAMPDCREIECGEYSEFDLRRCCRTCKDYVTPVTDTTPSSTSTSTPTPTTSSGVTQAPDKQTGKPNRTPTTLASSADPDTRQPTLEERETSLPTVNPTGNANNDGTKTDKEKIVEALASIGPIVGGAVGGVIVIVIIIAVACFLMRRSRTDKPRQQSRAFQPQPVRSAVSYSNNPPNPPYNPQPRPQQSYTPSERPSLKRQDTKDEVYDYIHPDDVRTVVSEPAFRPSLPDRPEKDTGYVEPVSSIKHYNNKGYQPEDPDYHAYHVLQKDDNYAGHNYTSM